MPFVTFPGNEIKDLSVFESDEGKESEDIPQPTVAKQERTERPARQDNSNSNSNYNRTQNNQQSSGRGGGRHQNTQQSSGGSGGRYGGRGQNSTQNNSGRSHQQAPRDREYTQPRNTNIRQGAGASTGDKQQSSAGTGEHLTHLRLRKVDGGKDSEDVEELRKEFDFSAGLSTFNKTEVLATVASESVASNDAKYVKDDFFDLLSNDAAGGSRAAYNSGAERQLNQDTFGAIAVQQSNFRRGGYRGGGRSGGGGRHSGGRGGRGGGRGSYSQDKSGNGQ